MKIKEFNTFLDKKNDDFFLIVAKIKVDTVLIRNSLNGGI